MGDTLPDNRAAVGQFHTIALEFTFDSAASAGTLGYRGADFGAAAVQLFESPFKGWVAWASVTGIGGAFADAVFLVQVAGSAVAASSFNPGANAQGYQVYDPSDVPFAASDSIAVEIDSLTTLRDCVVTLGLVLNNG